MQPTSSGFFAARSRWLVVLAAALTLFTACSKPAPAIQSSDLIQISELAGVLSDSTAIRPALFHVGFEPLYRNGHIPGSPYVGPGSKPGGLASLKKALASLPADQPVVLYCGCCPWTDCPNVRPAFQLAKESGRKNVRVLFVSSNLERDWIDKGFPTKRGEE